MKKDGFLVVQPWMVQDYNLTGNKLLVYALIYGFSQDEQSCFYGSTSYIMEYLHLSKNTVLDVLTSLEKSGLIRKWSETVNGRPTNRYAALRPAAFSTKNDGYDGCRKCTQTSAETAPKKENNNKARNKPRAEAREEPSSLTVAEVFDEFSHGGPAGIYDTLMDFDQHRRELAKKDKKKLWNALVAKKICKSILRLVNEAGVADRAGYAIAVLNQSIENGWTGVFAVKDFVDKAPTVHNAQPAPDKPRKITKDMTLADLLGGVSA